MHSSIDSMCADVSLTRPQDTDVPMPPEQERWWSALVLIALILTSLALVWFVARMEMSHPPHPLWVIGASLGMMIGVAGIFTALYTICRALYYAYRIMRGHACEVHVIARALDFPFLFLYQPFQRAYKGTFSRARAREAERARDGTLWGALHATPEKADFVRVMEYLYHVHKALVPYAQPADVVDALASFHVEWSEVLTTIVSMSEDAHRTMADEAHALGIVVPRMRDVDDPVALRVLKRKWNLDGECSLPEVDECDRIAQSAMSRLEMIRLVRIPKNGFAGEYVRLLLDILAMHGFESPFGSEVK